jgi:5-methylcytosine-specific restriction protein A
MPRKPMKPCKFQGCANLVESGMFCEQHRQTETRRYNRYQRDPEINKRYNSNWRKISAEYRKAHPICEECLKVNRLTPAALVHHIKTLEDGGTHEVGNLMALCGSCHSAIHAKNGERWR